MVRVCVCMLACVHACVRACVCPRVSVCAQVKDAPNVTWPTEAGAMYSLVMTGLFTLSSSHQTHSNLLATCSVLQLHTLCLYMLAPVTYALS